MVDPLSVSAVTSFLGAVSSGMAGESGRRLAESVGAMVARVAGREVAAPVGLSERDAVARLLVERASRDPQQARALGAWLGEVPVGGAVSARGPAPRLLPASVRFFADRKQPLALLDREASRKPDGRPRLAVVYGPEGIGTSGLALHWGGREAHRYPDGTLYADLRGTSTSTAPTAAAVLRHFLRTLHVPADEVPPGVEDRTGLFHTLIGDRRLLVVLDHARSAAQVQPLVSAAPGVFTVVVARRPPTGLDAAPVPVGPLTDKDARGLLSDLVGKPAVAAARATLPAVLERCGGSPFALRSAAPYLTASPVPFGASAGSGTGIGGAEPVRAAAAELYRRLDPAQARLYRLASLRAWPALSAAPAAAAAELSEPEAARLLAELAELRLLEETGDGRYRYRPAVRAHAAETAARADGVAGCAAAVARTVDWYLRFAVQADGAALKERWHVGPLYDELGPGGYEDEGAAITALVAELGNLVESVLAAEEFGGFDTACQVTEALWAVQLKAGHYEAVLPALRAGARSADRIVERAGGLFSGRSGASAGSGAEMPGRMHTQLALALMELPNSYDEAQRELTAAAAAEERAGHTRGQATAVETLGLLRLRQWRFAEALECFEEAGRALDRIGPADRGAADVPRARALLERHRGRALKGLSRFEEARERLGTALVFFRDASTPEPYNEARVLTDLAETEFAAGAYAAALGLIDQAAVLLRRQHAAVHLADLDRFRLRCRAAEQS